LGQIKNYRGRFAPTPSGALHFGSIVTALGSYLDAKSNKGKWFLRIDDIDQSRNKIDANKIILEQLEKLGLTWDGPIVYQSQNISLYETAIKKLEEFNYTFLCTCTRQELGNQIYPGTCRYKNNIQKKKYSIRIKTENIQISISDRLQNNYTQTMDSEVGDFIIKRSDDYFAYQLATIVDDNEQKITDIVRGFDLLDSTTKQVYLQSKLQYKTPRYLHLPIAVDSKGKKISKAGNEITPEKSAPEIILVNALKFLGHNPPDKIENSDINTILDWSIENWHVDSLPKKSKINYSIQ
jgi:glutamyl-Q tRNA(Asp) synthetase